MKRKAIQKYVKAFSKTLNTALKQELSNKSEDIIAREQYRQEYNKQQRIQRAQSPEKLEEIKMEPALDNDQLIAADLKKKKERSKSWGSYKAFGPVMAGGAVIGTSLLPGVGTLVGLVAGAVTGLLAGLVAQQIATKIGIPTIKAFKRALREGKKAYKEEYQEKMIFAINPQPEKLNLGIQNLRVDTANRSNQRRIARESTPLILNQKSKRNVHMV